MRVFVPVEDASLDADGEMLVPYRYGLACVRGLRAQPAANDPDAARPAPLSDGSSVPRPSSAPACAPGRH
jgi:hypothetical protein